MDTQQVFLVPQIPPLPSSASSMHHHHHHHQVQKCTTQMVQQPQHQQQPQCSVCGTTQKLLRCAKCKTIYYCSTNHQHLDWPTHKLECRQMAKQRQINNRLTQLTNGCGAININSHTTNSNISCSSTSSNQQPLQQQLQPQQQLQQSQQQNSETNHIDGSFILDIHKNELLNNKDESVTQNSNRIEDMGNIDGTSTATDEMHILGHTCLDLFDMINNDQHYMDNSYALYQTIEPSQHQQLTEQETGKQQQSEVNVTLPQKLLQQQQHGQETQQQQVYVPQQQQQQQQVPPYPVPQLSNHLINQHEKSSSYQIGNAVFDETIFENASELRYEELCRNIITDMNQYGLSVVDDFLGREKGLQILNEVHKMYSAGVFKDGQLVNNMKSEQDLRTIRGDKITWVKGVEPGCSNVGYLINQIDAVICRANSMLNNGKLGDYVIKERTKAMVACYPGSGSHYVMHVDNPNKDGRVITAIYYLNLNWDSRDSGGVLRIFPEQTKSVADIEPKFDRLIFFWSDKRNPHEVQPAHRTRYAITVWYFDANEREQALNRCKNTQNYKNTKSSNSTSSAPATTNSNTLNNTRSSKESITSTTSSSSSLSASLPTIQTSISTSDNSEASTANLTPSTAAINLSRPIQVVHPNIYK